MTLKSLAEQTTHFSIFLFIALLSYLHNLPDLLLNK